MQLTPHLSFNGQCEAAFKFYERCLGGKMFMLAYGNSPLAKEVSPEWRGKIVHASLSVSNGELAGADVPQPEHYQRPQGFNVLLSVDDPVDAERIFHALVENGDVRMPMQKTFWSPCFGVLVDQFGIPWEISCEAKQTA